MPRRIPVLPAKSTDDSDRESMRIAWNESADSYRKGMRVFDPYGFDLLARVNPKIRESALDLAAGLGEPAMSIARMVGPDGRVVGIDLSEQMVELATRIAKERRIPGLTFLAMDAERLDFPDESFDLVTSRFGFHIFAHPEDRKSTRLNSSHANISYAVFCLKKKKTKQKKHKLRTKNDTEKNTQPNNENECDAGLT